EARAGAETPEMEALDAPPSAQAEAEAQAVPHELAELAAPALEADASDDGDDDDDDDDAGASEGAGEGALPEWLRGVSLAAFADGYVQAVWTLPEPFSGDRSDVLGHRPYEHIAGITLSFLGLDVAYRYESVGARLDLRFGTSTPRLLGPTSGLPDGVQF